MQINYYFFLCQSQPKRKPTESDFNMRESKENVFFLYDKIKPTTILLYELRIKAASNRFLHYKCLFIYVPFKFKKTFLCLLSQFFSILTLIKK